MELIVGYPLALFKSFNPLPPLWLAWLLGELQNTVLTDGFHLKVTHVSSEVVPHLN